VRLGFVLLALGKWLTLSRTPLDQIIISFLCSGNEPLFRIISGLVDFGNSWSIERAISEFYLEFYISSERHESIRRVLLMDDAYEGMRCLALKIGVHHPKLRLYSTRRLPVSIIVAQYFEKVNHGSQDLSTRHRVLSPRYWMGRSHSSADKHVDLLA